MRPGSSTVYVCDTGLGVHEEAMNRRDRCPFFTRELADRAGEVNFNLPVSECERKTLHLDNCSHIGYVAINRRRLKADPLVDSRFECLVCIGLSVKVGPIESTHVSLIGKT
jgi:hypothetical protein